jgi:hypothetical protein
MIFPNPISFVKSMCGVVWHWFHGVQIICPQEVQQERQDICDPCDRQKDGQCLECTCFTFLKTQFSAEKCPKKKWGIFTKRARKTLVQRHD